MKLVFLIFFIGFCYTAYSQVEKSHEKTILDYYLLLPVDYFSCDMDEKAITRQFRLDAILKKDLENGYILAAANGIPVQVALFKDLDKKRTIVAVVVDCGLGCECNVLDFLEYTNKGKWKQLEILPAEETAKILVDEELSTGNDIYPSYTLPQTGTTIQVFDIDTKRPLYNLIWKDGKFAVERTK